MAACTVGGLHVFGLLEHLRPDVRGHDDDRVAEIDGAAVAVGEPAVVEHLQEHVEDVGVGLLDLVEQHHGVGPTPDRLGELAAFLIADVAGRRADQARHRVLLHVLRHVEADHGVLVVEEELGEGFARARSCRRRWARGRGTSRSAVGILQTGARPPDRLGDGLDRLVLTDHAQVEALLHLGSASISPSSIFSTGMPVHFATTAAMSASVTSSRKNDMPPRLSRSERAVAAATCFSSAGRVP